MERFDPRHLCNLDLENQISLRLRGLQSPAKMQKGLGMSAQLGADKESFEMFFTNWALHHDLYYDEKHLHAPPTLLTGMKHSSPR